MIRAKDFLFAVTATLEQFVPAVLTDIEKSTQRQITIAQYQYTLVRYPLDAIVAGSGQSAGGPDVAPAFMKHGLQFLPVNILIVVVTRRQRGRQASVRQSQRCNRNYASMIQINAKRRLR